MFYIMQTAETALSSISIFPQKYDVIRQHILIGHDEDRTIAPDLIITFIRNEGHQ